jgi:hypothetical protein
MKICAYCELSCSPTKEHIWPSSIIRKYEPRLKTYNKRINKLYFGDLVIKDVCSQCNNVKLSKLDSYLSNLYDQFFAVPLYPGQSTEIEYDYNLLLRSLLKISYNSSRCFANSKIIKAHSRYRNYILDGGFCSNIMLRLQVVTSARMIINDELSDDLFDATLLRCAEIAYDGKLSDKFIIRLVAINSFWFYIIISVEPEFQYRWKEFLQAFSSWKIQSGIKLTPSYNKEIPTTKLKIPASQTTYMRPALLGSLMNAMQNT